jgi:hypothetical protein
MLRDFSQSALGYACIALGDVAQRKDSDELLAIATYDRDPAYLVLAHFLGSCPNVIILRATDDVFCHYVAKQCLGSSTFCERPNRKIAVSDHTNDALTVADRDAAGIGFEHELSSIPNWLIGARSLDVTSHALGNLHCNLLRCSRHWPSVARSNLDKSPRDDERVPTPRILVSAELQ